MAQCALLTGPYVRADLRAIAHIACR
jgi:hypothetical protein